MEQQQTLLGLNRTGIQMSPVASAAMREATEAMAPEPPIQPSSADVRQAYTAEADPLGTVPVPARLGGLVRSGIDMLTGKRPQVLVDRLGQRLAFERTGVRLYEALLIKCLGPDSSLPTPTVAQLKRFRDQEAQHMALLVEALQELGADPTAQTPCADLAGVEGAGLVLAMNDPRTSVLQALQVMLDAELLDNAAWELLIELANATGHEKVAQKFALAQQQEAAHLGLLRELVAQLTLQDAGLDEEAASSSETEPG